MFSRSKDLPCNYLRFVLSIQNDLTVASSYIKCASLARKRGSRKVSEPSPNCTRATCGAQGYTLSGSWKRV
jgi:hypothetical protein